MRLRLAALALTVPLAACGSPDVAQVSALEVVRRAQATTAETGSARVALSMTAAGFTMSGTGVASLTDVESDLTMTIAAAGQRSEIAIRMIGDVLYLKMPQMPVDEEWAKFDLNELSKTGAVDIATLRQLRQNDPTDSLAYLAGVSDDVKKDGTEEVRGEKTTRYRVELDLRKAADASGGSKERIELLIGALKRSSVPATVWIDDAGRMRKLSYQIDLNESNIGAGAAGALTTTFEMYDFGVDVDVQPPPAEDTADGSEVFKK